MSYQVPSLILLLNRNGWAEVPEKGFCERESPEGELPHKVQDKAAEP